MQTIEFGVQEALRSSTHSNCGFSITCGCRSGEQQAVRLPSLLPHLRGSNVTQFNLGLYDEKRHAILCRPTKRILHFVPMAICKVVKPDERQTFPYLTADQSSCLFKEAKCRRGASFPGPCPWENCQEADVQANTQHPPPPFTNLIII